MIKVFMNKLACSKKENKLCIMNEHIIEVYFLFYLRLFLKDLNLNLVQIKKKKLTFKIQSFPWLFQQDYLKGKNYYVF